MVSTSGYRLLPLYAVQNLRRLMLPLTTILTPNIHEAKLLLEDAHISMPELDSLEAMVTLTQLVQKLGPTYVLLKGGHLPLTKDGKIAVQDVDRHTIINVLCSKEETILFKMNYLDSKNTHGTGCSLACEPPPQHPFLTLLFPWSLCLYYFTL